MKFTAIASTAAVTAGLLIASTAVADDGYYRPRGRLYRVTITNLTRGQILSPPVIFTHRDGFRLFELGQPASAEVAAIAEDVVNGPLETLLATSPKIAGQATAAAPVPPGQSVTLEVRATRGARYLGAIGMMVVTNDAFFGAQGLELPRRGTATYRAIGYDAGSEGNSELCSEIPGPPCGNPGVRNVADAEGYVHVHAGIHGIGDLVPSQHDWRNPVVLISVERVR